MYIVLHSGCTVDGLYYKRKEKHFFLQSKQFLFILFSLPYEKGGRFTVRLFHCSRENGSLRKKRRLPSVSIGLFKPDRHVVFHDAVRLRILIFLKEFG